MRAIKAKRPGRARRRSPIRKLRKLGKPRKRGKSWPGKKRSLHRARRRAAGIRRTAAQSGPGIGPDPPPPEPAATDARPEVLTSIIIPTFNGISLLRDCIAAIRTYTTAPYELIVVDNGSRDGTAEFCLAEGIPCIALPQNLGFPAACNRGLGIAFGDALLLLNNDVLVSHRWLDNMLDCLYSRENVGIVGPVANRASGKQRVRQAYSTIEQFHDIACRSNVPDRSKWREVKRIVGMCCLFKRELLERVGLLDERFSPGYYEDDDYCLRARNAGYRLMIAGDVLVHHHGSVSFRRKGKRAKQMLLIRNHRKFVKKWGIHPGAFR